MKYATAISPLAMNAAMPVSSPTTISAPQTISITPAIPGTDAIENVPIFDGGNGNRRRKAGHDDERHGHDRNALIRIDFAVAGRRPMKRPALIAILLFTAASAFALDGSSLHLLNQAWPDIKTQRVGEIGRG